MEQLYAFPPMGSKKALQVRGAGDVDLETPLYWIGSRDIVRAYTKGIEAIMEQARKDPDAPSYHWANYVSEAGLDPIQDYPLNIELGYYGSQALTTWPRSLDEDENDKKFRQIRDKRILLNTNVLAILLSADDLSTRRYKESDFPAAVENIRSVVGLNGTQQLADLLLTLIERGLDNDRVLAFTEALLS